MRRPSVLLAAGGLLMAASLACTTASDGPASPAPPHLTDLPSAGDPGDDGTSVPMESLPTPTPSRGVTRPGVCPGERLHATVTAARSSGPYRRVVVVLTNRSPISCTLSGYPVVSAQGMSSTGLAQVVPLPLRIAHGTVLDRRDPGARTVTMRHGSSASFAVGTTLRRVRKWTITQLSVRPDGAYGGAPVRLKLPASQSGVEAIPMTITAFVPGAAGPPAIRRTTPTRR